MIAIHNQYGIRTVAKDEVTYRSKFEADFVNKYLANKYDYIYEKPYGDGSKRTADFYIPSLDIYIECVYHDINIVPIYKSYLNGRRINLQVDFYQKDYVKKSGARWDSERKTWYKIYDGNNISSLEKYMYDEDLKPFLMTDGKAMKEDYDANFWEKVKNNPNTDIVIFSKDCFRYDTLAHFLIAKASSGCIRRFARRYVEVFEKAYK